MKTTHLSAWEHEECVLGEATPEMLDHLTECAPCRVEVARLERGVTLYRKAALEWSSECLATRPRQPHLAGRSRLPALAVRWAISAAVLFVLALVPLHLWSPRAVQHTAEISDDALLQQVDEQVSVTVPASMESLTHLVSTESGSGAGAATSAPGGKDLVRTN
jgi:hypothetical protein